MKNTLKKREWYKTFKLSYKNCEECQKNITEDNYKSFDFAHIDATTRNFYISRQISNSLSLKTFIERIMPEVKKCRLLCHECHKDETAERKSKE